MSKGGFKHTRAREPNSRDREWLEKLQLKLLQEKKLNRKDTAKLDYLYSESFLMGLDDNLNVTTGTDKKSIT